MGGILQRVPRRLLPAPQRALRGLGEGYRLRFSAPLLEHGPGDRGGSDAATLDAADAKLLRKDAGAAAQHDNKARSLLFFSGMEQVAGLHDFLANEGPTLWGRGYDVPMILAPVAFEGASVSRLGPWVTSTHGTDGAAAEHRAEYTGLIPPWCVDRLRLCIEESQRGAPGHERAAVTMRCAATPLSANLNFMPSEPAEAPAAPSPTGCFGPGCCTIEEQWRWSEPRVAAGSALVSEVKCNAGGSYDIVLRSVPGIQ
uniref:Uncharacterized protein n=1 Tax=Tetraselmis sp. GSL018 TaxID=582737 RepID=A0A061SM64_9CHLO